MKIQASFGIDGIKREVNWWGNIQDFPKLFSFKEKKWEWVMYDKDPTQRVDYILIFSELPPSDPLFYQDMEDFDKRFLIINKCECGALYTSFPDFHMTFCPLWSSHDKKRYD